MDTDQVLRDLNEIYRESIRQSQASFFGLSSKVVGQMSSVTPLTAASDLRADAAPKAAVETTEQMGLSKAA